MRTLNGKRVAARHLLKWTAAVFRKIGAPAPLAKRAATVLLYADASGIDTHGVANLERVYVRKCASGRIDPVATPVLVTNVGAAAVFDARRGLGAVAGHEAMRWAIAAAQRFGVGLAVVRNSSHFGAAGYYTTLALKRDMIGLAMTNLGSQGVAPPPGGMVPLLGTNPISAGAPAGKMAPFVLDMGTTAVATGQIRQAARQEQSIPTGWLADRFGHPVHDPKAFDRGEAFLQFAGGYKGYGLAVLVDILCGVLPSAGVGPTLSALDHPQEDGDVGHFFLAMNVPALRPTGFGEQMDVMLGTLLKCPTAVPNAETCYAGLPEQRTRADRLANGVPIDESLFRSLNQLAGRLGLPNLETSSEPSPATTYGEHQWHTKNASESAVSV